MRAGKIRLGHSLGERHLEEDDDALKIALQVLDGEVALSPRAPRDLIAVETAEAILEAVPRPIYSYAGDLHPKLGTVGLIVSRIWAERALQGVTRCDSGGLAGGRGCFVYVPEAERASTLRALSSPDAFEADTWSEHLAQEIDESYEQGSQGYVRGDPPDVAAWFDGRAHCIQQARECNDPEFDRRLWTWELRITSPPLPEEIVALALSYDASKRLNSLVVSNRATVPDRVKILAPTHDHRGPAHWFDEPHVRQVLAGNEEHT